MYVIEIVSVPPAQLWLHGQGWIEQCLVEPAVKYAPLPAAQQAVQAIRASRQSRQANLAGQAGIAGRSVLQIDWFQSWSSPAD